MSSEQSEAESDENTDEEQAEDLSMDVTQLIEAFKKHIASIDGGGRATPEIYALAVRQVIAGQSPI